MLVVNNLDPDIPGQPFSLQERAQSTGVSPIAHIRPDDSEVTKVYDTLWENHANIAKVMIGYARMRSKQATVPSWAASTAYLIGAIVKPTSPNGFHYRAKQFPQPSSSPTRNSSTTEPTWSTAEGGETIESNNEIIWETISPDFRYLARYIPHADPNWSTVGTGREFLFAQSAEILGLSPSQEINSGTDSATGAYKGPARHTYIYKSLPYDVLSDAEMLAEGYQVENMPAGLEIPDESTWKRYCIKNVSGAVQFFTVPRITLSNPNNPNSGVASYFFQGTDLGPGSNSGIGKLISYDSITITQIGVPAECVPSRIWNPRLVDTVDGYGGAIDQAKGKVNITELNGYPIGTLLCTGIEMKPRRSCFGDRVIDITVNMKYFQPTLGTGTGAAGSYGDSNENPIGHNHVFDPISGKWREVVKSANAVSNFDFFLPGVNIYDWFEFKDLWRCPQ